MADELTNLTFASVPRVADRSQARTVAEPQKANLREDDPTAGSVRQSSLQSEIAKRVGQDKEATQPLDKEELTKVVEEMNQFVQSIQRELRFSIDEDSQATVIKVFDSQTDQVIRQIPAEEILNVMNSLSEMSGVFLREQA